MSLRFQEDEEKLPWLAMLLDVFEIADENVKSVLGVDCAKGMQVACRSGCGECCTQPIPLTSLELSGIIWFIRRKMSDKPRMDIEKSIRQFKGKTGCPLLIGGKCAVYPVRPVVCRHFVVYGEACGIGEDVMETRPEQVLTPDHAMAQATYKRMLPYYGITEPGLQQVALDENYLFKQCSVFMHQVDWDALLIRTQ